jgi:hypothetical protein
MAKKHEVEQHPIKDGTEVLLLNSFDGAEAIRSKDNVSSVISFSSQIFTASQIQEKEIKAGSSFNMFTWLQVLGKESISVMKVVGEEYFKKEKCFWRLVLSTYVEKFRFHFFHCE